MSGKGFLTRAYVVEPNCFSGAHWRRLLGAAVLALTAALLPAAEAAGSEHRVLRIGTSSTYPPLTFIDEHNRFQGFEVELGYALCARMNVACEFHQEHWDDLIPALLAGRFDAIMSSISITDDRRKRIAFSKPYYHTPSSFTTRRAANLRDTSPEAMKGRLIGALIGTIHVRHIEDMYVPHGASLQVYASQQEAQLELSRGRLDAILTDKVGIYEWLEKSELGKCCTYAGEDVTDPAYIGEGVGVGLRHEDLALKRQFDAAIDAVVADGTYKQINDKYFPFSLY